MTTSIKITFSDGTQFEVLADTAEELAEVIKVVQALVGLVQPAPVINNSETYAISIASGAQVVGIAAGTGASVAGCTAAQNAQNGNFDLE